MSDSVWIIEYFSHKDNEWREFSLASWCSLEDAQLELKKKCQGNSNQFRLVEYVRKEKP